MWTAKHRSGRNAANYHKEFQSRTSSEECYAFSLNLGLKGYCILRASSHDQNHQSGCVLSQPVQIKRSNPIEASSIVNRKGIVFYHENVRMVSFKTIEWTDLKLNLNRFNIHLEVLFASIDMRLFEQGIIDLPTRLQKILGPNGNYITGWINSIVFTICILFSFKYPNRHFDQPTI